MAEERNVAGGRLPPFSPGGGRAGVATASRIRVDASDVQKLKALIRDTRVEAEKLSKSFAAFDGGPLKAIKAVSAEIERMQRFLGVGPSPAARARAGGGVGAANQHAGSVSYSPPAGAGSAYAATVLGGGGGQTYSRTGTFGGATGGGAQQATTGAPTSMLGRVKSYLGSPPPKTADRQLPRGTALTAALFAAGGTGLMHLAQGHLDDATLRSYLASRAVIGQGRVASYGAQQSYSQQINRAFRDVSTGYADTSQAAGTVASTFGVTGRTGATAMAGAASLAALDPTRGALGGAQGLASVFNPANYYRARMMGVNAGLGGGADPKRFFDQVIGRVERATGHPLTTTQIDSGFRPGTNLYATLQGFGDDTRVLLLQYWRAKNAGKDGATIDSVMRSAGGRENLASARQATGAAKGSALTTADKGLIPGYAKALRLKQSEYGMLEGMANNPLSRGILEASAAAAIFAGELKLATTLLKTLIVGSVAKGIAGRLLGTGASGAGSGLLMRGLAGLGGGSAAAGAATAGTWALAAGSSVAAGKAVSNVPSMFHSLGVAKGADRLYGDFYRSQATPAQRAYLDSMRDDWVRAFSEDKRAAKHDSVWSTVTSKVHTKEQERVYKELLTGLESYGVTPAGGASPDSGGAGVPTAKSGALGPSAGAVISVAMRYLGTPYRWGGNNPRSHFDCIAAGVLVTTARGEIPIEDVNENDLVLTRKGFRRVLAAWKVRDDAETLEMLIDGRWLRATADHRVWTENRGWVAFGDITEFDTLVLSRSTTTTSAKPRSAQHASVYDISVDGEHEFFANGVLVHNCSGIVQWAYGQVGIKLPRVARQQQRVGREVAKDQVSAGDLLFFGNPAHHVGMSIGGGKMIHAPHTGDVVKISDDRRGRASNVKRVLGSASTSTPASDTSGGSAGDPGDVGSTGGRGGLGAAPSLTGGAFGTTNTGDLLLAALSGAGSAMGVHQAAHRGGVGSSAPGRTASAPNVGGGRLSIEQIARAHRVAGFRGEPLVNIVAISLAESGGRPSAHNANPRTGDDSYGLDQINMIGKLGPPRRRQFGIARNEDLLDPEVNAHAAYLVSGGGRVFSPWSTWKNGRAQAHVPEVRAALGGSYARGAWELLRDEIAELHKGEMVLPAKTAQKVRETVTQHSRTEEGGRRSGRAVPVLLTFHVARGTEGEMRRAAQDFARFLAEEHDIELVART